MCVSRGPSSPANILTPRAFRELPSVASGDRRLDQRARFHIKGHHRHAASRAFSSRTGRRIRLYDVARSWSDMQPGRKISRAEGISSAPAGVPARVMHELIRAKRILPTRVTRTARPWRERGRRDAAPKSRCPSPRVTIGPLKAQGPGSRLPQGQPVSIPPSCKVERDPLAGVPLPLSFSNPQYPERLRGPGRGVRWPSWDDHRRIVIRPAREIDAGTVPLFRARPSRADRLSGLGRKGW